jgi:hypothetical protein
VRGLWQRPNRQPPSDPTIFTESIQSEVTDGWTILGSVGEFVGGIASATGLFFIGYQIRQSRKDSELKSLVDFLEQMTRAEDRLQQPNAGGNQQAYFEFLNLLETYSGAINSGLVSGKSKEMIVDKLCSCVAEIENIKELHKSFETAVTSSNTFAELVKFNERHRVMISQKFHEALNSRRIVS